MRLIIKDNMSYLVGDGYYPYQNIEVDIDIPKINHATHKLLIRVNNLPARICVDKFILPLRELEKPELCIGVSVRKVDTGTIVNYPMDPINMRKSFLFGNNVIEQYPATFLSIQERVLKIEENVLLIMKAVKELEERGEVL